MLVLLEANTVGTTGVQFATLLNTIYGGTNYRASALDGASTGAGRPIAVYNAATVSLMNETGIGITSSTGQPRQTHARRSVRRRPPDRDIARMEAAIE